MIAANACIIQIRILLASKEIQNPVSYTHWSQTDFNTTEVLQSVINKYGYDY